MARYLKSLGLLATLGLAPMALSAPTLNTTTGFNGSLMPRGNHQVVSHTMKNAEYWNKWAQFCDDPNCSQNCGISVQVGNPGCLEQPPGRKSIKMHGMRRGLEAVSLTVSPRKGCNCQALCTPVELTGPRVSPPPQPLHANSRAQTVDYCWTISTLEWYDLHTEWSFRFQQTATGEASCGSDQCHWNNTELTTAVPT